MYTFRRVFGRSTQLFSGSVSAQSSTAQPRSLSGSMWSYVVCFTDPLHSIMRAATDLNCFTVCFWTGMDLSLGLFTVTWLFVRLLSVCTFYKCLSILFYGNFVITCFSC